MVAASMCIATAALGQSVKLFGNISSDITEVTLKAFDAKSLSYLQVGVAKNENGKFIIQIENDSPNLLKLDFDGQKSVKISLTNENSIQVNFQNGKLEIKGSPESVAILSFENENQEMQGRYFGQLKKDADVAMASGDPKAMEEIQARSVAAIQEFLVELRQWIIDKGEGPAGYYAIQFSDFNKELEFIETRLATFQKKIPNSTVTKALARQVYQSKVVSIGKNPPAIEALDREGKAFSLDQYKGKVLLIDFWAAWCRACRFENPQLVKVFEKYHADGFEVVSISQDETKEAWNKAIAKDGVGVWRHIWDKNERITELYSVGSLPQNVVLGSDGKIIAKNVNAEKLDAILKKTL